MKDLEPYAEPLYRLDKCAGHKADEPPTYLQGVTLAGLAAYYFNWHTDEIHVSYEVIALWFKTVKGWVWRQIT